MSGRFGRCMAMDDYSTDRLRQISKLLRTIYSADPSERSYAQAVSNIVQLSSGSGGPGTRKVNDLARRLQESLRNGDHSQIKPLLSNLSGAVSSAFLTDVNLPPSGLRFKLSDLLEPEKKPEAPKKSAHPDYKQALSAMTQKLASIMPGRVPSEPRDVVKTAQEIIGLSNVPGRPGMMKINRVAKDLLRNAREGNRKVVEHDIVELSSMIGKAHAEEVGFGIQKTRLARW